MLIVVLGIQITLLISTVYQTKKLSKEIDEKVLNAVKLDELIQDNRAGRTVYQKR